MRHIKAELHCHTYLSGDCLMLPEQMLEICALRGIERIAITDHNSIEGALEAKRLDPERVIIGEEIQTTRGELLGYFVKNEIPGGLDPEVTIQRLRDQGAFISVSHPLDHIRSGSWAEDDLRKVLHLVDALEGFNARSLSRQADLSAMRLAEQSGLLVTAGSDAHAYCELGRSGLKMPPFTNAIEFRDALTHSEIIRRRSSPLVHFLSRYASLRKALGWVAPDPRTFS